MQIVGIDFDEKQINCSRIQNTDKPEFVKIKQFTADKRGLVDLETWLDECCEKDRKSLGIAVIVDDQTGASLANRMFNRGFAVTPLTMLQVAREFRNSGSKERIATIIARQALQSNSRWMPMSNACLMLRAALFEREIARIGMQSNLTRQEGYQEPVYGFLAQLTQNAANIHAERMAAAEQELTKALNKAAKIKAQVELLKTIPGMTEVAAATLALFANIYPSKTAEQFASCLCLVDGKALNYAHYRSYDLRLAHSALFSVIYNAADEIPAIKALCERLEAKDKSQKTIDVAAMHKLARIIFAMLSSEKPYQA
jgi:transposase